MEDSVKDLIGMSPQDIKDKFEVEFLKKYPEAPCELDDADVDRLSLKHSYTSDKYWRMFAGSSSELLSYKNGVVEIEITTSRQKLESEGKPKYSLRNQLISWLNERLLGKATHLVVHIMQREKPVGFALDAKDVDTKITTKLAKNIAKPNSDLKVAEWRLLAKDLKSDPKTGNWPPEYNLVVSKGSLLRHIGESDQLSWTEKPLFSMSSVMQRKLAELINSEELTNAKSSDYAPSNLSMPAIHKSVNLPRFCLQMLAEWTNENLSGINYLLSDLEHNQHLNLYNLSGEWTVEGYLEDGLPETTWQATLDFILLGLGELDWDLATENRAQFIRKLKSIDLEPLFQVEHLRFACCNEIKEKVELFSKLVIAAQPNMVELMLGSAEAWVATTTQC